MLRALALATLLLAWLAPAARADYLEVRRSAKIKATPTSDGALITRPEIGAQLVLASTDQTNGYYRVRLPASAGSTHHEGWIYRTLVRRFPGLPAAPVGSGQLEVHVIDVGQGDAILVRCPDGLHQVLIDSGDNRYPGSAASFRSYMTEHQELDDPIEIVVASHPHADHIGSMAWVLTTYDVDLYVDNGLSYDSRTFDAVELAWATSGAGYWPAIGGDGDGTPFDDQIPAVDFCPRGDVFAEILRPEHFGQSSDPNDNSVIVRVEYGATSFLFVGDAEAEEEELLLDDPATLPLLDVDVLKVGHHGSETSTSDEFLAAVSPEFAVISCGERGIGTNARYLHPRASTLNRILDAAGGPPPNRTHVDAYDSASDRWRSTTLNDTTYVSAVDGSVVLLSDGLAVSVGPP